MVALGAGFRGVTLYRPKYSLRQKKRSSLQNELVFSPKVCDDQKKMVSPQNGDTRGGQPPLATPLGQTSLLKTTNRLCEL